MKTVNDVPFVVPCGSATCIFGIRPNLRTHDRSCECVRNHSRRRLTAENVGALRRRIEELEEQLVKASRPNTGIFNGGRWGDE